jgi:predicted AAA+ superfamily ATPase
MWVERDISQKINGLSKSFPAVVVTGARQTGKTSLLRRLFADYTYVSLDIPSTAEMASRSPHEFFNHYSPPMLVDEVQYAPELFRHVKVVIDQHRHTMG